MDVSLEFLLNLAVTYVSTETGKLNWIIDNHVKMKLGINEDHAIEKVTKQVEKAVTKILGRKC